MGGIRQFSNKEESDQCQSERGFISMLICAIVNCEAFFEGLGELQIVRASRISPSKYGKP